MTDREAFELLHKHIGEKGIFQCKEMLRMGGLDKTLMVVEGVMRKKYGKAKSDELMPWTTQAITFLNNRDENENLN
jgi:hypothetical protein